MHLSAQTASEKNRGWHCTYRQLYRTWKQRGIFIKRKVLDMQYNLPDRVFEELCSFAQKYSVNKIILFGSRARGTNTERSDIDIAVYGGDFDGFYWDVKEKIYSLLMFDIVQADTSVSDDLKQEIEKDGVVIYEKA